MASELGISSSSASLEQLKIRNVVTATGLLDTALGSATVGQGLKWDATNNNWVAFDSHTAGNIYAVLAEAIDVSGADANATIIVGGELRLTGLDATTQADADAVAAFAGCGIYLRSENTD